MCGALVPSAVTLQEQDYLQNDPEAYLGFRVVLFRANQTSDYHDEKQLIFAKA